MDQQRLPAQVLFDNNVSMMEVDEDIEVLQPSAQTVHNYGHNDVEPKPSKSRISILNSFDPFMEMEVDSSISDSFLDQLTIEKPITKVQNNDQGDNFFQLDLGDQFKPEKNNQPSVHLSDILTPIMESQKEDKNDDIVLSKDSLDSVNDEQIYDSLDEIDSEPVIKISNETGEISEESSSLDQTFEDIIGIGPVSSHNSTISFSTNELKCNEPSDTELNLVPENKSSINVNSTFDTNFQVDISTEDNIATELNLNTTIENQSKIVDKNLLFEDENISLPNKDEDIKKVNLTGSLNNQQTSVHTATTDLVSSQQNVESIVTIEKNVNDPEIPENCNNTIDLAISQQNITIEKNVNEAEIPENCNDTIDLVTSQQNIESNGTIEKNVKGPDIPENCNDTIDLVTSQQNIEKNVKDVEIPENCNETIDVVTSQQNVELNITIEKNVKDAEIPENCNDTFDLVTNKQNIESNITIEKNVNDAEIPKNCNDTIDLVPGQQNIESNIAIEKNVKNVEIHENCNVTIDLVTSQQNTESNITIEKNVTDEDIPENSNDTFDNSVETVIQNVTFDNQVNLFTSANQHEENVNETVDSKINQLGSIGNNLNISSKGNREETFLTTSLNDSLKTEENVNDFADPISSAIFNKKADKTDDIKLNITVNKINSEETFSTLTSEQNVDSSLSQSFGDFNSKTLKAEPDLKEDPNDENKKINHELQFSNINKTECAEINLLNSTDSLNEFIKENEGSLPFDTKTSSLTKSSLSNEPKPQNVLQESLILDFQKPVKKSYPLKESFALENVSARNTEQSNKMTKSLPKIEFESGIQKSPKVKCTCMNKFEKENRKPSTTNEDILKNQITDIKNQLNNAKYENDKLKNDLEAAKIREDKLKHITAELENEKLLLQTASKTNFEAENLRKENEKLSNDVSTLRATINEITLQTEKAVHSLESKLESVAIDREIIQRHLDNAESAFSDVHQKYEHSKQQVVQLKKSDEALRKDIDANEETIQRLEQRYDVFKVYAINQIDKGNAEFTNCKKHYEAELSKFQAQLKRYEIKCNSLMLNLQQKTKENEELANAFDEMIGKS